MTKTLLSLTALAVGGMLTGPALAHREELRPREIALLAHDLERAAERVHRRAERFAHRGTFLEEKALERLHALEDAARSFHRDIEARPVQVARRDNEFRALLRAFYRAENSFEWLRANRSVERDFERVEQLVELLERHYDIGDFGWYSRGHGSVAATTRARPVPRIRIEWRR